MLSITTSTISDITTSIHDAAWVEAIRVFDVQYLSLLTSPTGRIWEIHHLLSYYYSNMGRPETQPGKIQQ